MASNIQNSCKALIEGFQEELQEDVNFHKVLLDFIQKKKVAKVHNHKKEEEDSDENSSSSNVIASSVATMESQDEPKEDNIRRLSRAGSLPNKFVVDFNMIDSSMMGTILKEFSRKYSCSEKQESDH